MPLRVGLVGLPNVGKSTLFNALSQAGALAANYPFATVEPNVGVVPLPDPRLDRLAELAGSRERTPTTIELVDIAGLVSGASEGEGLGNRFLAHIREVDAVCHVVRCFEDDDVSHVAGRIDPIADIEVVETELALKDLESVSNRLERERRTARSGDRDAQRAVDVLERLHDHLAAGDPARTFAHGPTEATVIRELFLLTAKPVLYAANVDESDLPEGGEHGQAVRKLAEREGAETVTICAQVEAELTELPPDEAEAYLATLGLERPGLERLVHAAHRLLRLVTFFTANPREARAWTVPRGTTAPGAAGEVHSDMQRGFIRAEVISFEDHDRLGSEAAVRDAGLLRVEGKDYEVREGDVMFFRFNV